MVKIASLIAMVVVLFSASTVSAHNWGADPSDTVNYCSTTSDSECSADNQYHYLYYNGAFPTLLHDAFNRALDTDYSHTVRTTKRRDT